MTRSARARGRWRDWLPALAVMALIFVLSSQSGLRVSDDSAVDRPFRISGHLLAFGALGAALLFALARGERPRLRDAMIAVSLTVVYGVSDELHQSFVPDRTGRLDDLIVDAVGAFIGVGLAWAALSIRARHVATADDETAAPRQPGGPRRPWS